MSFQVLEDIGLMKKVRRFAGASAGSITAGLLSIGYTAKELQGRLIDEDVPVHGIYFKAFHALVVVCLLSLFFLAEPKFGDNSNFNHFWRKNKTWLDNCMRRVEKKDKTTCQLVQAWRSLGIKSPFYQMQNVPLRKALGCRSTW